MSRTVWVGTSWKMTKTRREALDFARALVAGVGKADLGGVQPFVIPSATALAEVSAVFGAARGRPRILTGAQNAHWEDAGAWTGELSVPQVADAGAEIVELGHSERRQYFAETDSTVNLKVHAVLRNGLRPLVCVGETSSVRDRDLAVPYVLAQVEAALDGIDNSERVILAYEPVWAIGARGRVARVGEIRPVVEALADQWGDQITALLYGGSVSVENAGSILDIVGVDGLFVGRAAWSVDGYLELLRLASDRCGS